MSNTALAMTPSGHHRRRGVSYVFFLGAAMLVTVIGLSALTSARIHRRSAERANDLAQARFYAQSAVERGFVMISQDPAWRDNLGSGAWVTDQPIGNGMLSLEVTIVDDGDGQSSNDPAVLTGTGASGAAQHRMQVTVMPDRGGMVIAPGGWEQVQ